MSYRVRDEIAEKFKDKLCRACRSVRARPLPHYLGHHELFCSERCAVSYAILKALEEEPVSQPVRKVRHSQG